MRSTILVCFQGAAVLFAAGLLSSSAGAVDHIWQSNASSDWNTGANWFNGVPLTPTQRAVFNGTGTQNSITLSANVGGGAGAGNGLGGILVSQASPVTISQTANSLRSFRLGGGMGITIDPGAGAFTMQATGAPGASGIQLILNSTATYMFANNSANTAALSLGTHANSRIVPGGAFSPTLLLTGSGDWDIDTTIISGGGPIALTKDGNGTLILRGASTYTGDTRLEDGTLAVGNDSAMGTSTLVITGSANSTFRSADAANRTVANPVVVGTHVILGSSTTGDLLFTGDVNIGTIAKRLTINNDETEFSGVISGTGIVEKRGPGTLILSGENTHSGGTTLNGGTLALGHDSAAGTGTLITTTAGGAIRSVDATNRTIANAVVIGTHTTFGSSTTGDLLFTGDVNIGTVQKNLTINNDVTEFRGVISGTGEVEKRGPGALILSGANIHSGGTTLNGGTLALGHDSAAGTGTLISTGSGGTIRSADTAARTISNPVAIGVDTIFGSSTTGDLLFTGDVNAGSFDKEFTIDNAVTEFSGVVSGGGDRTKLGPGTLIFSGANTYSGDTRLEDGTLAVGHDAALGTGTFIITGANNSTFRSADAADRTLANPIVVGRHVIFGSAGTGNLLFTGDVNAGNATKNLTINNAVTEFSGVISGGGAKIKSGPGTLIFSGANTYTGLTSVNEGTLLVNGSIPGAVDINSGGTLGGVGDIGGLTTLHDGGTVSPGQSPGTLFADDFNWQTGGTYHWEINDPGGTAGQDPGWDLLDLMGGDLAFMGSGPFLVNIDASGSGFDSPADFDPFEIAIADSIAGFAPENFMLSANTSDDFEWTIFQQGNSIFLEAQSTLVPEPSSLLLFVLVGSLAAFGGLLRRARRETHGLR